MKQKAVIAPEIMEEVIALYQSAHRVTKEGDRLPTGDLRVPGPAFDALNLAVGKLHEAISRMRGKGC